MTYVGGGGGGGGEVITEEEEGEEGEEEEGGGGEDDVGIRVLVGEDIFRSLLVACHSATFTFLTLKIFIFLIISLAPFTFLTESLHANRTDVRQLCMMLL